MSAERKPTIFEERVYDVVRMIPRGKVSTYLAVAGVLGIRSAQAIGQALKRNPYAPEVPCHRVVASGGKIGGFYGESSGPRISDKCSMLLEEGVRFKDGTIDLTEFLHTF